MKKVLSLFLLLFLLFSQFQVTSAYADSQSKLETQKEKSIKHLDKVEQVVGAVIEQIDEKIHDSEQETRLREKQQEIEEYIEKVQGEISEESSKTDIKEIVKEAKKVVILKVVSGATSYEDVEENIPTDVANTPKEKKQALETIQDSLETKSGDYSLIIRTKYSQKKVQSLFDKFDGGTQLDLMHETDGKKYFEVIIGKDSIFRQEMMEDIEKGVLPESFLGIEIILPEVFGISTLASGQTSPQSSPLKGEGVATVLSGEDLTEAWGIEEYQTYQYFSDIESGSKKIRVGVVDTGIDYNHPDLKQNVVGGYDFVNDDSDAWDDQGHGTHVSGTIAANINGSGIIGVNPYVELVPLKICNSRGFCPSYAVLKALDYAKKEKLDILNMSLGGRGKPTNHPICQGIKSVVESGGIVVAASGNSNIDTSRFVPGGCSYAITVGAVDQSGNRAPFSNYGTKVDVAAPGVQVYSSIPGGKYRKLSGTSMSTPHIVGLISIIQSYRPDITANEVKVLFKKYSKGVHTSVSKPIASSVDVKAMIEGLKTSEQTSPQPSPLKGEGVAAGKETLQFPLNEGDVANATGGEKGEISQKEENSKNAGIFSLSEGEQELILEAGENTHLESITETKRIEQVKEQEEDVFISNIESNTIEFGDQGVEINSIQGGEIEGVEVPEIIEGEKEFVDIQERQVFDEEGNDISESVEINSSEENTPTLGQETPADFDINNLPDFEGPVTADLPLGETSPEKEIAEPQQVLIDGAEAGVEINSVGEEDTEEIVFDTEIQEPQEFLDEEGNLIDFSELEAVEAGVEDLDYTSDDEVFVDGAEAGVEINSVGEEEVPVELELPEYNAEEVPEFEVLDGGALPVYDESSDENTPPEGWNPEWDNEDTLLDIAPIQETLDIPVPDAEIRIDGAETGVEINSFGEDEEPTMIETEEYNSEEEPEVIDGGEGETPEALLHQEDENEGDEEEKIERPLETYTESGSLESSQGDSIGIQNTYYCTIELGQSCSFRIYKSYSYQFKITQPEVVTYTANRREMYLKGQKAGTTTYDMYYGGRHYFTLYVTVVTPQPPKEYTISVEQGKYTDVHFPIPTDSYRYRIDYKDRGKAQLRNYKSYVRIEGRTLGNIDYYIQDAHGKTKYIIHTQIIPKKPIVIDTAIFKGQTSANYLRRARGYNLSFSKTGVANVSVSTYNLHIQGLKEGQTKLYAKQGGILKYIFNITIKEIPKPKTYNIIVMQGKNTDVYLPSLPSSYSYSLQRYGSAYAYFSLYGKKVTLKGHTPGDLKYFIRNASGFLQYTFNVKVIPAPPTVVKTSVMETKTTRLYNISFDHANSVSVSNSSMIQVRKYGRYIYFTGKISGIVKVYIKNAGGKHTHTYEVQVIAKPIPKTYSIKLKPGGSADAVLPEDINKYRITQSGNTNIFKDHRGRNKLFQKNARTFGFITHEVGNAKIILWDKDGFEKYIINIDVEPYIYNIEANVSDEKRGTYSSFHYSGHDGGIVSIGGGYYTGLKAGTTTARVYRDGKYIGDLHVTIHPKPTPKTLNCTTQIDNRCLFKIPNSGYYYTQSRSGIAKLDIGKTTFDIRGRASGNIKLYVKSPYGDYITHILNVIVQPRAIRNFTCSTPSGTYCKTNWWGNRNEYKYRVSKSGIIDLRTEIFRAGSVTKERLSVRGLKAGLVDIYVYNSFDHIATFRITIEPPIPRITIGQKKTSIGQGESIQVPILSGGGEYKSNNTENKDIVSFTTRSDSENTGRLKITGKNPGRTSISFKDKYNQTYSFGITVEDTILRLSTTSLSLSGDNYEYISIPESYQGIKTLTVKDTNVAKAYLVSLKDETKVIKVYPVGVGTTSLVATDFEGNEVEVRIVVEGEIGEEDNSIEETIVGNVEKEINDILKSLGLEINGVQEDNQKKKLADIIGEAKVQKLDDLIDKYGKNPKLTDSVLSKIIVKLENGVKNSSGNKKRLYEYVHISFIIIKLERQEGKNFTKAEKRTLKDTLKVYYTTNLSILDDISVEVFDKIVKLNDQISYDEYIKIGEKLELIGVSGMVLGGVVCETGVAYAATYSLATDGSIIIPAIVSVGSCTVGGGIAAGGAGLGVTGLLMQGGGRLGRASQGGGNGSGKGPKWSKQDKELGKPQLDKVAKDAGYGNIENFKQDLLGRNSSRWDAFKNEFGEVYFKAKTSKGANFEPIFTGFFTK